MHALLAKWSPPEERSKLGAFVYAGECYYFAESICSSEEELVK